MGKQRGRDVTGPGGGQVAARGNLGGGQGESAGLFPSDGAGSDTPGAAPGRAGGPVARSGADGAEDATELPDRARAGGVAREEQPPSAGPAAGAQARAGDHPAAGGCPSGAPRPFRRRILDRNERFDPDAEYVWAKSILYAGERTKAGERVDTSCMGELKLRALWATSLVQRAEPANELQPA